MSLNSLANINTMLNLILFGPPGSGKGTQADKLKLRYNLLHVSTGEVIRNEIKSGSELGIQAEIQMGDGGLASDELVCGIINNFIKSNTGGRGVIYDGFPRTTPQAKEFDKMLAARGESVTLMIALDISDDEVIRRITTRGLVSGRADDQSVDVIQHRIDVYKNQTAIVTEHYAAQGKYHVVCGNGTIEETYEKVCAIIDSVYTWQ